MNYAAECAPVTPQSEAEQAFSALRNQQDRLRDGLSELRGRLGPVRIGIPQPGAQGIPMPEATPSSPLVMEIRERTAHTRQAAEEVEELIRSLTI